MYEKHPAFRLRAGWCVFDVGANIGMFALKAVACRGAARVCAFEPNRETFARLQTNLRRNHLISVQAVQQAVGEVSGWASFDLGSTSTVGHLSPSSTVTADALQVEVVTLHDFIQKEGISMVHLLKMDVEGAEAAVLRGAGTLLERCQRIVFEYHSAELLAECEEILERHGFRKVLLVPPAYAYFLGASVEA